MFVASFANYKSHVLSHDPSGDCIIPRAGLDVATCGVANATGFDLLTTYFSSLVASLAAAISSYHFIYLFFHFLRSMTK